MKAKLWIMIGFGCIAASILVGFVTMEHWSGQVERSFASDFDSGSGSDPRQGFGGVMLGAVIANLLFIGGIIVVIVGFIKLAKEPSRDARCAQSKQERTDVLNRVSEGGTPDSASRVAALEAEVARLRAHAGLPPTPPPGGQ